MTELITREVCDGGGQRVVLIVTMSEGRFKAVRADSVYDLGLLEAAMWERAIYYAACLIRTVGQSGKRACAARWCLPADGAFDRERAVIDAVERVERRMAEVAA